MRYPPCTRLLGKYLFSISISVCGLFSTMSQKYEKAIALIDEAHSKDPKIVNVGGEDIPYELHYARKMTDYLEKTANTPWDTLRIAIRAQHFRRWEVPRDSFPMTRVGYFSWRAYLKKRQA